MEDLDYIKKFSKISITSACKKANVQRTNVLNGKASAKSINKVKKQIENDVAELYLIDKGEKENE